MGKQGKRDITALMGNEIKPETKKPNAKVKRMNIRFDADDEAEIRRIRRELEAMGLVVWDQTQIIRVAMRTAMKQVEQADIAQIVDELSQKWKRGA